MNKGSVIIGIANSATSPSNPLPKYKKNSHKKLFFQNLSRLSSTIILEPINAENRPFFSPVLEPCFFCASGEGEHSEEWSAAERPVGVMQEKKQEWNRA